MVAAQADEDAAREAFRRGAEAAQEERWADSEREFRRAYALSGVSSALFNQAVALRALGRHVEARAAFDALLRDEALDDAVRTQAEELRAQSEVRIATLAISGLAPATDEPRVQLDGEVVHDDGSRPLELAVDEGRHALSVEREGFEPFRWSGEVAPGSTEAIEVRQEALPELTPEVIIVEQPRTPIVQKPWFWVVVGVVVLGGAAALITGLMVGAQLEGQSPVVFDL
jgi:hypothetical protein